MNAPEDQEGQTVSRAPPDLQQSASSATANSDEQLLRALEEDRKSVV